MAFGAVECFFIFHVGDFVEILNKFEEAGICNIYIHAFKRIHVQYLLNVNLIYCDILILCYKPYKNWTRFNKHFRGAQSL